MAHYDDHLAQAQHNEAFASQLMTDLKYKDWLITVSFYAAIHYVEAEFTKLPGVSHSETSVPPNTSLHAHRENLVRQHFGKPVWQDYRKLHIASNTPRYLTSGWKTFISGTGHQYFSDQDAKDFFIHKLAFIKGSLGY